MKKIAVIYWSGSGNTKTMAEEITAGAASAGISADLFSVSGVTPKNCAGYDGFMLGCPAMGNEILEESEFEPFYREIQPLLAGKPTALFGSYSWGDGEWMRTWEAQTKDCGAALFERSLIIQDTPDEAAKKQCAAFAQDFIRQAL